MPPKSWFSKKSRHLELFFRDFFSSEKADINRSKVKAQITTRPIFYTEYFMEHAYFRISSTAVTTRKFFIQGTVPTCTYNTMNIYYTDVFFTNTCDRPYGVARTATRGLHHCCTSKPLPHSYLQCQNICVHSHSIKAAMPPLLQAVEVKQQQWQREQSKNKVFHKPENPQSMISSGYMSCSWIPSLSTEVTAPIEASPQRWES